LVKTSTVPGVKLPAAEFRVKAVSVAPLTVNVLVVLVDVPEVSPAGWHVEVVVTWLPCTTVVNAAAKETELLVGPEVVTSSQQSPVITSVAESGVWGQFAPA
jgi:hypothetical protein